jgi:hypothetical protein
MLVKTNGRTDIRTRRCPTSRVAVQAWT